ncbi:MAG: hypothetical protein ABIU07_08360, partial [Ramlibacter sp.]
LLEKGFTVNVNIPLRMYGYYTLGGGPNTSRPASSHDFHLDGTAPIHVQCMGNPEIAAKVAPPSPSDSGMAMDNLKAPFVVNSVELSTLHTLASKTCPVDVTIKAALKGVGGGEVKYWLEEVGGNNAVQQLTTSLPGKAGEPNTRVLMQTVSLKPGPQDQALPSVGLNNLKIATDGVQVKRSYRLHVIAPNKIASDKLDVAVQCTSTLNAGLGGSDIRMAPPAAPAPKEMNIAMPQPQAEPPRPLRPTQVVLSAPIETPRPGKPARVGRQP